MAWWRSNAAEKLEAYGEDAPPVVAAAGAEAAAEPTGALLIQRLRRKLGDLAGRGYAILWIAAPESDLVTLFREGGDDVIQVDPDPAVDRAWFEGREIRPSQGPGVWIYLEGEYDEISRHSV